MLSQEDAFALLKRIVDAASNRASVREKVATWNKAFQFRPSDADPFFLEVKEREMRVAKGVHSSPAASLVANHMDLVEILSGRLDAFKAFFSGKLKVQGNILEAQSLNTILRGGSSPSP